MPNYTRSTTNPLRTGSSGMKANELLMLAKLTWRIRCLMMSLALMKHHPR